MIPSTTTHVREQLKENVGAILRSPYIINVLLKEFEDDVVKAFTDQYVNEYDANGNKTKDGKTIEISTNFPQDWSLIDTRIFIGAGDGSQTNSSIGMEEGDYYYDKEDIYRERLKVTTTKYYFTVTTGKHIMGNVSFRNLSIDDSFIEFHDNIIQVNLDMYNQINLGIKDGVELDVSYDGTEQIPSEEHGTIPGFTAKEFVSVVLISKNMDTLRILDAIVKSALILMRSDKEEQSGGYALGDINYQAIQPLDTLEQLPELIFGREIDIQYTVSYGMQRKNLQDIKHVLFNE